MEAGLPVDQHPIITGLDRLLPTMYLYYSAVYLNCRDISRYLEESTRNQILRMADQTHLVDMEYLAFTLTETRMSIHVGILCMSHGVRR